ncbi:MAG TPA: formyltransferase family protein [Minicystis sp.]|nr:formyltransferase family protein [Minicystis sp.]
MELPEDGGIGIVPYQPREIGETFRRRAWQARRVALRIAYFGLPLAALLLAKDGHELAFVALSRKAVGLRRAERAFADRLVYRPDVHDPKLVARVRAARPDLVVSWFWTNRLPMELVRAARLGGIGAHPSLLPRHRGPDPTTWAILAGDAETGVSVHRLEADYDTGDVLAQERLAIDPAWNAWQLARRLDRPSLRLLRATVARFAAGEDVEGTPQDPTLATEAPFLDEEACALRFDEPTDRVLRRVRALAPAPGAWTEIAGHAVVVTRAEALARFPRVLAPGEGAAFGGAALVRTKDGAIRLLEGEIDGRPADEGALLALFG